jgi:hypothetical protein
MHATNVEGLFMKRCSPSLNDDVRSLALTTHFAQITGGVGIEGQKSANKVFSEECPCASFTTIFDHTEIKGFLT